jgi:hypothetical protein
MPQDMDEKKCLPFEKLLPLDRYMLHLMSQHQVKILRIKRPGNGEHKVQLTFKKNHL